MSVSRLSLFVGATLFFASSAGATHALDHRYLVLGYVRDGAARPVPHSRVRVVREKTGLPYQAETDADGFYLVIVHLHDEDLGDVLQVTTGRATIGVQTRFDPRDAKNYRGTRIDFWGGRAEERREIFFNTLREYLKQRGSP